MLLTAVDDIHPTVTVCWACCSQQPQGTAGVVIAISQMKKPHFGVASMGNEQPPGNDVGCGHRESLASQS